MTWTTKGKQTKTPARRQGFFASYWLNTLSALSVSNCLLYKSA